MRSASAASARVLLVVAVVAGQHGHARCRHATARALLVAHQPVHLARRADEHDAGGRDRVGEVAVLAQEAVAGVDRLGSASHARRAAAA